MKSYLQKLLNLKPKYLGGIYLLIVPAFSFIFLSLPQNSFNIEISSFLDGLYLSSVVISTLGFGDIYPITDLAKITVLIEALFGVLLVGLFLNSIANMQALSISKEEKRKIEREKLEAEQKKLLRIYEYVKIYEEKYLLYLYQVITPVNDRDFENMKFSVQYQKMYDFYTISTLQYDDIETPLIVLYYSSLDNYNQALEKLLFEIDLNYFPEIAALIKDYFKFNNENCFKNALISFAVNGKNKHFITEKFIKNFNQPLEYKRGAVWNQFLALYNTIVYNVSFVDKMNNYIKK